MTTQILPNVTVSSLTGTGYTLGAGLPANGASVTWTSPSVWTTSDAYTIAKPHTTVGAEGKLELHGKKADIEINGKSLVTWLERIEQRLNLLSVNAELESEWDELRELGNQYRELEQRIKDKQTTWDKLRAQDKENR
jgi:hypothetical protein